MTLAEMNLDEREKAILRKRLGMNDDGTIADSKFRYKGQKYTVFFAHDKKSDKREYEPITICGQVPAVGDRMYFKSLSFHNNKEGYDHNRDYRKWYVKEVFWSYNVQSTAKDQLLYDHTCYAEVIVDYNRLGYWWENLTLKCYHWPKNNLKRWLSKLI